MTCRVEKIHNQNTQGNLVLQFYTCSSSLLPTLSFNFKNDLVQMLN